MNNTKKIWVGFGKSVIALAFLTVLPSAHADECDFIRAALGNAETTAFVIPAGRYICDKPIVLNRDGLRLRGEGKVVLRLADHANCPLVIMGNIETPPRPVHNLQVRNLTLDGNRDNQDGECWGGDCDKGGTAYIRNNGITVRAVHGALIEDVNVYRMRSGGVVTEKVSSKLHVKGLVASDNYYDGFAGYETTDSVFEDMDLSNNLGAGVSLDIHFNKNVFKNVRLYRNMDVGIYMRDSAGNTFFNFRVQDSGNHAVYMSQVDENACTGAINNAFENFEILSIRGDGVHVNTATCTGNKLINFKYQNIRGKDVFERVPGILKILESRYCDEVLGDGIGTSINAWNRSLKTYHDRTKKPRQE